MSHVTLFVLVVAVCSPAGRNPPRAPDAASNPAPVSEDAVLVPDAALAGARELVGTLRYTPVAAVKSVEAYLGVEFQLETAEGPVVLSASAQVPEHELIAQQGRAVALTCIPRAPVVPSPEESYPVEADGQPMKRPAKCEVVALRTF